jgi:hypothetical protein
MDADFNYFFLLFAEVPYLYQPLIYAIYFSCLRQYPYLPLIYAIFSAVCSIIRICR